MNEIPYFEDVTFVRHVLVVVNPLRICTRVFRIHQVKQRSLGLEVSHTGIRLLMQWDDLLEQQRWSGFLAWPSPTPANILTK